MSHPLANPLHEQAVISRILLNPKLLGNDEISNSLFSVPLHVKILDVARELDRKGETINGDSIAEYTQDAEIATHAKKLGMRVLGSLSMEAIIQDLKQMAMRRNMLATGESLIESAKSDADPIAAAFAAAASLATTNQDSRSLSDSKNNDDLIDYLSDMGSGVKLPTGFKKWDALVRGFHPGMQVMAARPGGGKTTIGGCIAGNVCFDILESNSDEWVLFFSGEMSGVEIKARDIARISGVPLMEHVHTKKDLEQISIALRKYQKLNLIIDDKNSPNMDYVESRIRGVMRDKKIKLIIIDYLQRCKPSKRWTVSRDKVEQIAAVSNHMSSIGKELKIPILALAQLKRAVKMYSKKDEDWITPNPTMDDLKGSGDIEQDAEWIGLLHGLNEISIGKNRHGTPEGSVKLRFSGPTYNFSEID